MAAHVFMRSWLTRAFILDANGWCGGPQQVRLSAHCRTHRVVTTKANPSAKVADNALNREFEAQQPNQKWVADVTSIGTASGWLSPFRGA